MYEQMLWAYTYKICVKFYFKSYRQAVCITKIKRLKVLMEVIHVFFFSGAMHATPTHSVGKIQSFFLKIKAGGTYSCNCIM